MNQSTSKFEKITFSKLAPHIVIILLCAWVSRDIVDGWRLSWHYGSLSALNPVIFILWLLPLLNAYRIPGGYNLSFSLSTVGLLICIIGQIGELHVLGQIGLALSLGSLLSINIPNMLWIVGSIGWMPAFCWVIGAYNPQLILLLRLAIVGSTTFIALKNLNQRGNL